jgi:hypothetical protein
VVVVIARDLIRLRCTAARRTNDAPNEVARAPRERDKPSPKHRPQAPRSPAAAQLSRSRRNNDDTHRSSTLTAQAGRGHNGEGTQEADGKTHGCQSSSMRWRWALLLVVAALVAVASARCTCVEWAHHCGVRCRDGACRLLLLAMTLPAALMSAGRSVTIRCDKYTWPPCGSTITCPSGNDCVVICQECARKR